MPFGLRRRDKLVETRTTRPTLMTRLKGRNARKRTVKTTTEVQPRSAVHGHQAHHHTHHTHGHNTRSTGSRWGSQRTAQPAVVHRKRHVSFSDKVGGAMTKLRGSLTGRPGVKAAGTRRMHGTDGRRHRGY